MTLEEALAAFATTRSRELADTIEVLGAEAIDAFVPPAAKKNLEFHRAWLGLVAAPATRTWCLATLLDKLPNPAWGVNHDGPDDAYASVAERLAALEAIEPDPRIARAMLGLLELRAPASSDPDNVAATVRALIKHADVTTRSSPQLTGVKKSAAALLATATWPGETARPSDLDGALAQFATTRSSALADSIEQLGKDAVEGFEPPALKKNLELHRRWLELATDPAVRTWCLTTLIDKLPKLYDGKEHPSGDKSDALEERLAVLQQVPPDPRIARALLALLELRAPVIGAVPTLEAIARALVVHADDTTIESPEIAELRPDCNEILDAATWPKRVAVKAPAKRARQRDLDALYAAVYASPEADAPREVLADALQEANDPRGEFIALQLREARGDASEELRARAQELAQQHGKLWLGPLRAITYRAQMRRGFLAKLELAGSWASNKWASLAREPMLATLEELARGQATGKVYASFLAGLTTRTLRSIEVFDDAIWKIVETTPMPHLDRLAVTGWTRKTTTERFTTLVLPWLAKHPEITRLACDATLLPKLPKTMRLRELATDRALAAGTKLWAAMPKLERLTLEMNYDPIEFVRNGKRPYARLISTRFGSPIPGLRKLPPSIKRVEVVNNATQAKELAKAFPKLEIVSVRPPSGTITGVK